MRCENRPFKQTEVCFLIDGWVLYPPHVGVKNSATPTRKTFEIIGFPLDGWGLLGQKPYKPKTVWL